MRRRSLDRLAAESTQGLQAPRQTLPKRTVPCLSIAWHPDIERIGERAKLAVLDGESEVELSRLAPQFQAPGAEPYPLADGFLSRRPIHLRPGNKPGALSIDATASGIELKIDGETPRAAVEVDEEGLRRGTTLVLSGRVVLILHRTSELEPPPTPNYGLVGESDALSQVRAEIARVTELEIPVLLRGPTGTGKELVAEAIHQNGGRKGPLLAINLAAVPPTLAAAELFGAAKGAYTGASAATPGYFRRAAGGTLLLDEIGEVTTELQPLLLRVLESGEIQPVGGGRPVKSDVRVIAATDADLEAAVTDGSFRAPLLHRLASYTIHIPSLADRREDIGPLLLFFLRQELQALGRGHRLEPAADTLPADSPSQLPWLRAALVARLIRHDWPGNVRELRNVARRLAVAFSDQEQVPAPTIDEIVSQAAVKLASSVDPRDPAQAPRKPADVDEAELIEALRAERWRPKAAALRLGIPRPSIYHLMRRSSRITIAAHLEGEQIEPLFERHGDDIAAMADELEVSERALRRRLRELELL